MSLHIYNNVLAHCCRGRKRWILSVPVKGALLLDAGAVRAIRDRAKSLFSAGIMKVVGDFAAQDAVSLCDEDGAEFGRGLCNYRHDEVARVQVGSTQQLEAISECCWSLLDLCEWTSVGGPLWVQQRPTDLCGIFQPHPN